MPRPVTFTAPSGRPRRLRAAAWLASLTLLGATPGGAAAGASPTVPENSIGAPSPAVAPLLPSESDDITVIATGLGAIAANLQNNGRFPSPESPFRIAVVSDEARFKIIEKRLQHAKAAGRPLTLARVSRGDSVPDCEMAYLDLDPPSPRVLPELARRNIVTVGRQAGFLRNGGMFELATAQDAKLKVRLDLETLRPTGFTPSASLMRISGAKKEGRP